MVKALQTRLPPISRKKKRRGDIRAYISRGGTLHVVEGSIQCEIQQEDSNSRRIQVNDKHVIFFVECDGSGVKFVHAAAKTVSVSDVLDRTMLTGLSFFPELKASKRHISELKAKANSEVAGSDVDLKISSFQAVLAHMWRSIIRKSGLNPEEVTHCNMRQRLNPPIGLATATTTAGEMLNNGLG
ncbi:hypothetical protein F2Q70_00019045 [Brassica cretica]|uniref:Uncharacterized protein n=2 Tax=Brassica TaxID=3705 RepID=A0A8S9KUD5_BRACR|nr:hypothetical protein F2Q70_00019045 [Brassica cretica]KAF2596826.1 hypothetical protein F2Q68_00012608 [Brassica cretica]